MFKKGQKSYSIFYNQCPKCHGHSIFKNKPYHITGFSDTYDTCPNCGEKFEKEPGFFYGAMYVSYALQVAELVAFSIAFYVLAPDVSLTVRLLLTIGMAILLIPLVFRLSRSVWINLFIHYTPQDSEERKA